MKLKYTHTQILNCILVTVKISFAHSCQSIHVLGVYPGCLIVPGKLVFIVLNWCSGCEHLVLQYPILTTGWWLSYTSCNSLHCPSEPSYWLINLLLQAPYQHMWSIVCKNLDCAQLDNLVVKEAVLSCWSASLPQKMLPLKCLKALISSLYFHDLDTSPCHNLHNVHLTAGLVHPWAKL